MSHQSTLPNSHLRHSRKHLLHPRHRRPLTWLLLFLGALAVASHLFTLPSVSTTFYNKNPFSSTSLFSSSTFTISSSCTKEIGPPHCCALFLAAEPCTEKCRRQFVDRETMELGLEWENCEAVCLAEYKGACGVGGERVVGVAVDGRK